MLGRVREELEELKNGRRKRRGAGVVDYLIGLMVVIIVAVAVVIPVINDTIKNANLSGTSGTILSYVPLMIIIGVFMMAVALIRGRA